MQSNLETCTRSLRECVGRNFLGPVTLDKIEVSLTETSIVITHTVSCAKSSVTAPTTEASPKPLPCKPTSPSQSSSGSNLSTSKLFPLIYLGINGPTIHSNELDSLLLLLDAND